MTPDFSLVSEQTGQLAAREQLVRLSNRYYWAGTFCKGKEVVEVACGSGQGLGYLSSIAKSIVGGDISPKLVEKAKAHYGERLPVMELDALNLPFPDKSKDVVILFEAIYYLPSAEKFVIEAKRVLREGGKLLIVTANKDLYDFNPSPFSHTYFGVVELEQLLGKHGFTVACYGGTPVSKVSIRQRILRPIKKAAVKFNLIPKTMGGKEALKRLVFGKLEPLPAEILSSTAQYEAPERVASGQPNLQHKVIYCEATLARLN